MRRRCAIFTTRCGLRKVDVESVFVPGHPSGLGRHRVYVTAEGAAVKTRRQRCTNEVATRGGIVHGIHCWCELRNVHVRHVERVQSHRVAPGRPERLGRNPARIATVDDAVRSVERSWGRSIGGMKFSVSVHVLKSAPSHTTLSCQRRPI